MDTDGFLARMNLITFLIIMLFLYAEVLSFYLDKLSKVHIVKLTWTRHGSQWKLTLDEDFVLQTLNWYLRREKIINPVSNFLPVKMSR